MLGEKLLILSILVFSGIYGVFTYHGDTTKGFKVSITFLLSLYIAGKILLVSDSKLWGLLVPVLVFYLTSVGYYSLIDIDGRLDDFLSGRKRQDWNPRNILALTLLLILFEVVPLIAVYLATHSVLLSITVGLGTGLFFFTLSNFKKAVFKFVFNIYTILTVVTTVLLVSGLCV
ncbi:hypothetical protein [Thermococcus camini]|uniref:Uncharacterized protein n=1 Tax=Thermococcus camini TaxID=2016373 RepID=A0A7G2D6E5_9EURY|nr:hypothetical protein [Thermococcus camini]CAD5243203.1 conserved membrane protein of unknown function [Thermococcus camini]